MAESIPLHPSNLDRIRGRVAVPAYDRKAVQVGIVHVGVGNFHRAHQAAFADEILHRHGCSQWGICGVGLLASDRRMRDALVPQEGLYTLIARGDHDAARVIGSVVRYLHSADSPEAVLEMLAAPSTQIVSLTITEGGYPVDPESGEYDPEHPEMRRERSGGVPRGTFGFLLEALRRRRDRGIEPFTVLSCDNVQGNGDVARRALLGLAGEVDGALRDWIDARGAFPNSVVDRITPATTDDDRAMLQARFGIADAWPVITEPFRQWVLEDRFSLGRPPWENVGVQFAGDVRPYETLKLRCLNGGHSAIAYPGALLGYAYIHEIARDVLFRQYLRQLWDREVIPALETISDIEPFAYTATLIDRFSNPATRDQTSRVCMDGSSKLPTFILPSIRHQLRRGGSIRLLSFVVACWCRYLSGRDEEGRTIEIEDPMAADLRAAARRGPLALLNLGDLFGDDLPREEAFLREARNAWHLLSTRGVRAALTECLIPPDAEER